MDHVWVLFRGVDHEGGEVIAILGNQNRERAQQYAEQNLSEPIVHERINDDNEYWNEEFGISYVRLFKQKIEVV